jgi:putative membrane protein
MYRITGLALTFAAAGFFAAGPALAQSGSTSSSTSQSDTQGQTSSSSQSGAQTSGRHSGRHANGQYGSMSDRSQSSMSGSSQLDSSDKQFLIKSAQDSMAEVEMAKLAQERGSSNEVKQLGQRLEQDHTKSLEKIRSIAQSKGVDLPQETDSKQKAEHQRLSGLSGESFDRAFLKSQEQDHKKDIAEFRRQAERAKDPDVKQFAEAGIPTLQEHERMTTQAMASTSGVSSTSPRTDTEESATAGTKTKKSGKDKTKKSKSSSETEQSTPPSGSAPGTGTGTAGSSTANPR